ncbi:hypothetical protein B0H34DRAFT_660182 [Crassisporium funariophilum]|nr:hypothetical protein B0H34DRAFT_660182 [Crassisporium funariophilum]
MPSWLVTGASRGIGLGIVRALLKNESNFVIATARNPDIPAFQSLSSDYPKHRFLAVCLDVKDPASISSAVAEVSPHLASGLDYIVNNAGIHPQPQARFEDLDLDVFAEELTFSTVVVLRVTRAFLPLIKQSTEKKIIFITSVLASSQISYMMVNQCNAYSVSKAALNMIARKWGASLKNEGVITATIHPGWVRTEIGDTITDWMTTYASHVPHLEPEVSGAGVVKVAEGLTLDKTASYWNWDGTSIPW